MSLDVPKTLYQTRHARRPDDCPLSYRRHPILGCADISQTVDLSQSSPCRARRRLWFQLTIFSSDSPQKKSEVDLIGKREACNQRHDVVGRSARAARQRRDAPHQHDRLCHPPGQGWLPLSLACLTCMTNLSLPRCKGSREHTGSF